MVTSKNFHSTFVAVVLLLAGCVSDGSLVRGRCVRVIDGDTIVLADGTHVRLTDRDAFEIRHGRRLDRQAAEAGISTDEALRRGYEQAAALRRQLGGADVVLRPIGRDRWGRMLAELVGVR